MTAVVAFYMAVALTMVIVYVPLLVFADSRNKWVLTKSDIPLLFLFFQLAIAVVCLHVWSGLRSTAWSHPRWSKAIIKDMTPVAGVNVVGLVFNIYCLKLVDASYFQVARGLVLPMTIALQSAAYGVKSSITTIVACSIVSWGFLYQYIPLMATRSLSEAAAVKPEAPGVGMLLGVLSAAMIAIHAILIKSALPHVNGSTLDLAYWTNILSLIAVTPAVVLAGELPRFMALWEGTQGDLHAFALGTVVTVRPSSPPTNQQGLVGFLICIAGLLSIKITSPVTHMFSSAARSVLQTVLGVRLFGDILSR